jgi:Cys-tRNA(Pro)/Cys-tRNA(Cys) deacylase
MSTRGIYVLREANVPHEILEYRYDRVGARLAAAAVGRPEAEVLKSLVFCGDDEFFFVLVASDAEVSTRKVGRATGHKHVEPAAPRDAQRVTGYLVGGISPLGARQPLPILLDEAAARRPHLVINAGARGTLVRLATADLIAVTGAVLADVRVE